MSAGQSFVVHYQEIALKGKNRPWFLAQLVRSLRRAVADLPGTRVNALMGRLEVVPGPAVSPDAIADRIRHTFGIANFSFARRVPIDLDGIAEAVLRDLGDQSCEAFRVSARRADKRDPLSSPQIEREVGGRIKAAKGWRVDLEKPEIDVRLEFLSNEAFYFFDKHAGPGGMPIGTAGRVVCLLSGGIDSPVAAWRMMKRGCRVVFVHFHSVPYLPPTSQAKARALVERLTGWQYASQLYLVPFGEIQREVVLSVPPPARVVVYRRLMVRIAEEIARRTGALALATGESLGQVASQTLENIARIDEAASVPILRPLIGMDKLEITEQAKQLGTFEISIEPDADCCTLFTPKHPFTRMQVDDVRGAESRLDVERLVAAGVEGATVEAFEFPAPSSPRADAAARSVPSPSM